MIESAVRDLAVRPESKKPKFLIKKCGIGSIKGQKSISNTCIYQLVLDASKSVLSWHWNDLEFRPKFGSPSPKFRTIKSWLRFNGNDRNSVDSITQLHFVEFRSADGSDCDLSIYHSCRHFYAWIFFNRFFCWFYLSFATYMMNIDMLYIFLLTYT